MKVVNFPKKDGYARTKEGAIKKILSNAVHWLDNEQCMAGIVRFNEFSGNIEIHNRPHWDLSLDEWTPRLWTDVDYTEVCLALQRAGIEVGTAVAQEALVWFARKYAYNPVIDYLESVEWDQIPRVDFMMHGYFGAEEGEYSRRAGAIMMLSAVARVMEPGCKADVSVVLEGKQGQGKSESLRVLFSPWFSDNIGDLRSKDAIEQLSGMWCVEIAELAAMKHAEVEHIKAFLSRQVDVYRRPYGRCAEAVPRRNIFVMTTNEDGYLKDSTGNRRFWPIRTEVATSFDGKGIRRIEPDWIARDRDQLWAEAYARWQSGEKWWVGRDEVELLSVAEEQQKMRYSEDPWATVADDYITKKGHNCEVTVAELLGPDCIGVELKDRKDIDQKRMAKILKYLGLIGKSTRRNNVSVRIYKKSWLQL